MKKPTLAMCLAFVFCMACFGQQDKASRPSPAAQAQCKFSDGKTITTDGPFAETVEQLGGTYVLDCKDLDEAIRWAAKIPVNCWGGHGCIEIRPIKDLPVRSEQPANGQYATSLKG